MQYVTRFLSVICILTLLGSPLVADSDNQSQLSIDASERSTPEALLNLLGKFIAERDLESSDIPF